MLDPTTRAAVHPREPRQHVLITGMSLAKAQRGACQRAVLAAYWTRNALTITNPTVTQAARVFQVSTPMINAAIEELEALTTA